MIETHSPLSSRVKTYQVVGDQAPEFSIAENPLFEGFLKQYYISQEYQGGPVDIGENIDKYIKIDNLTKDVISGNVSLASSITTDSDEITVSTSTKGFPQEWGLLKIDNEIITYTGVTTNTFTGCIRGFSGITTYHSIDDYKNLSWTETLAAEHDTGSQIQNLSSLFLQEFYDKLKAQYTPGLEGVKLSPELDINNFVKEARSLYESKGTNESFKILFKALFGLEPKINDLEKYLIKPSYANYLRRESFAVQVVTGDPNKLIGQTLFQDNEVGNPLVNAASGPISEVVQIRDDFYRLSVFIGYDDRDLIQGSFVVPGRTQAVGSVGLGATVITVDSTIGFGQTGTIEVGVSTETDFMRLEYTEKTVNQFIGVTTTSKDIKSTKNIYTPTIVYGYEDNNLEKPVTMKITGVLSDFDPLQDLYGLSETSKVNVKNLGRYVSNPQVEKTFEQVFFNSWVYNTSGRYLVEDLSGATFTLKGDIDKASLRVGDKIEMLVRNTETVAASPLTVTYINNVNNSISVSGAYTATAGIDYDIRRLQEKATSTIVPIVGGQSQILSDVSNTYVLDNKWSESGEKEGFVASNSIPSYPITSDKVHAVLENPTVSGGSWGGYDSLSNRYTIISFPQSVPFRTGEEIAYVPIGNTVAIGGLDANSYFVEVLSQDNKIKLYPSRSFIPSGISIKFAPPDVTTGTHDFIRVEQARKSIFPGRTLKRFILDQNLTKGKLQKTTSERTLDGNTGMLVNGVEITNYKSDRYIYYGPLKALDLVNAGTGYDVLNPPAISIENSSTGVNTAFGRLAIGGTVTDVLIDPVDFEIKKVVSVDIHGGNGGGAVAQAITELAYRQFTFNAKSFYNGGNIDHADPNSGRFIMDKPHYYKTGDRVLYSANNNNVVGIHTQAAAGIDTSLVEGQSYYVGIHSDTIFKLYTQKSDAIAGVNTIGFGSTAAYLNNGIHQLRDYDTKRRISRVSILDGGSGYTNKRLSIEPTGVSTFRDFIEFPNHGFKDGEVVHYGISTTVGATAITGLSTNSQYQIISLDEDKFRLCYSGIATTRTPDKTNYLNKEYVRFTSHGVGYQDFSYPPVTVDVNVITDSDTPVTLKSTPIVRGKVTEAILFDKGRDYGSNIINFEKAPAVDVNYGAFGQIGLTIVNGRIIDAFVQSKGSDYDGPPDLEVIGVGSATGAKLRAVMDGREISSIVVLSQGVGYAATTTNVSIKPPGDSATFSTRVRPLVANKYKTSGTLNGDYLTPVDGGLAIESVAYGATVKDAFNDDGTGHSPIIGWAYDGNPIYGPYGLTNIDDIQSSSTRMISSYKLDSTRILNRPSLSEYEAGFFVEDYYYDSSGDLDEHNGRFCKTPEFEEGVYAYFATVDNTDVPVFPYYIGDTYRGFPLRVNTVSGEKIKQLNYSFEESKLVRNTLPYNLFGDGVAYDFVYQPYKQIPNVAIPDKIGIGGVERLQISSSGIGYTFGAQLNFDESGTGGSGVAAKVNLLKGKTVNKIDTTFKLYENIVFEWKDQSVIGHFDPSHGLEVKDYVQVAGLSTSIDKLVDSHVISTVNVSTKLLENDVVGLVTDIRVQYIPVSVAAGATIGFSTQTPLSVSTGSTVGIATTVQIGQETAHILNVYNDDSVLRIRRSTGVTTTGVVGLGVSYFADEIEIPIVTNKFISEQTKKIYFNPTEAVGFGTTTGQTITRDFEYLGVTATRSIKTQNIHLENHGLKTNDALSLTVPSGGATLGLKTDSVGTTFNIPDPCYAVRKTENTIGIKTTKTSNEVYFVTGGTDAYDYLFTHTPDTQVTGSVQKITTTIQTAENHELETDDEINLIVKPGLATGIGTTTFATVKIIDNYLILNPLNIDQTGINTTTNRISVYKHNLITGDKILYYGSNLPDGIVQREYYVVVIDENTIQLTNTFKEASGTPNVVNITSQGGSGQTINPINPQLRPFRNNDLVFDMSDPTLSGNDLKFYYDNNYFNEFVGSGTSLGFEIVGVHTTATVGVASTNPNSDGHPTIKIRHSETAPKIIYYSLFSSGISTADKTVFNGSQIKYVDSSYTSTYPITSIGNTTFNINLEEKPESLNYTAANCDIIEYTTRSTNATGGIASTRILSPGLNYSRLPGISSIGDRGENATLIAESDAINKLQSLTVPEDVYGYPSDNTLRPDAFVPRVVNIDSFSTIDAVNVIYGGKFYITAPALVLYDKATGDVVETGLITCELSDSAVTEATVSVPPIGLSNNDYGVAPVRNSNGISIINVQAAAGILTCTITTPVLGYVTEPIAIGDKLMVEGVAYDAGSGTGYNSQDYKFIPFEVTDYNDATNPREVTFDLNGISTNPGTGATVSFGFGQLTQAAFIAQFEVVKGASKFIENEPFKRNNNPIADVALDFIDSNAAKIIVSGAEPLEINDILTGKLSGSSCRVIGIKEFDGSFNIASSVKTLVGWRDNVGLINDTNQVLPDNDYYQNLSYAIESPKTYEDLVTYVNDIVHPSGLKNFANTEVMASGKPGETNIPAEDAGGLVLDFIGDPLRVDSIYPFDLARDFESQGNISKFVELRATRLSDFILNRTNRVLNIDDISPKFVSNESNDLSDYRVVATYPGGRYFQRWLTQSVHQAEDPAKNHYQFNEFISVTVDEDTFLLQKQEMQNWNQVAGLSTGYATFDTRYNAGTDITELLFRPNEPFDTDYEVKSFQTNFSDSVGSGSSAFGHIRLEGGVATAGAGSTITGSVTTNIFGISTSSSQAAIVQLLAIDNPGTNLEKQVDYLEYAIMHDGVDTYLTELAAFNSKQNLSGLSAPQFIGTVTSKIEGGLVKFDFENGRSNNVTVKYKSIIVDPSTLGDSNYRFKIPFTPDGTERSARLETSSQSRAGITTIVGITSLTDLTVKSTVHVSYGATQSLHQIYMLSDPEKSQTFISETPLASVGSTTGIGTFGSTYRSDGTYGLEFHPSVAGIVSVTAYNEVLYKVLDPNGTRDGIGDINYGSVYENVAQTIYLGINNRNIKSFDLNYLGIPIYARETNIADANQINRASGMFNQKHFFSNYEQLTYTPDSNLIGIGGSALIYRTGAGVTGYLPSTVYAIKDNNQQYRIALTENDAKVGAAVTFLDGTGTGNKHRFSMRKRDEKSMISISGLVQKPISYTSIEYDLNVPVVGYVTAFVLSGISSVQSGDLLKIEDEYSIVRTVGFGTTTIGPVVGIGTWTLVEVERGAVGTAATSHAAGETARLFRGSFQILDSQVHFTKAPLGGDLGITNAANLPYARATFGGRAFLRKDYSKNQIFDDISEQFDGLETTYPLTSIGVAVTGIGSTGGNGVLFINNIFQAPYSENNTNSNFKILDNPSAGIASVQFTGISSIGYETPIIDVTDINENQLPRGGIIISVASTPGRGYAPFRGANVRPVRDAYGVITDLVGFPTEGTRVAIETAYYDNESGIMEVSTVGPHNLELSESVYLNGLQMECIGYKHIYRSSVTDALVLGGNYTHKHVGVTTDAIFTGGDYPHKFVSALTNGVNVQSGAESGNQKTPNNAAYNAGTGVLTLEFASAHGMSTNDTITLDAGAVTLTCERDNYQTPHSYPRSSDPISGVTTAITKTSNTAFTLNVGISTRVVHAPTSLAYDALKGEMKVAVSTAGFTTASSHAITTCTYDPTLGQIDFTITGHGFQNGEFIQIPENALIFTCAKDSHGTQHTYPRNSVSGKDRIANRWLTIDQVGVNTFRVNVGKANDATAGVHTYVGANSPLRKAVSTIGIQTNSFSMSCERDNYATTHTYPRAGYSHKFVNAAAGAVTPNVGTALTPTDASYNETTGDLTLTFPSHALVAGTNTVQIAQDSLVFTCDLDGHNSQHSYPRTTDPFYGTNIAVASTTATTATMFVGKSGTGDPVNNRQIGIASIGVGELYFHVGVSTISYVSLSDAAYNSLTGDLTLSIGSTGVARVLAQKGLIGIATGAITMSCDKDGYATNHAYPRVTDPYHNKIVAFGKTTSDTITVNVGKSGLGYGSTIGITSFVYDYTSGIATVIADGNHNFTDPNLIGITTGGLTFTCNQDGYATNHTYPRASDPVNDKFLEIRNVTNDTFDVFVGITTNVGWTPTNAVYDPVAGIMTMTIPNHNIMAGNTIKIKGSSLDFKCAMDGTSQTKSYPRPSDPYYDTAISVASTTATGIAITVGTSPTVNYSVTTATYTPTTGFLDLNIGQHGLAEQTAIKLATGSLIFRCANDSYISSHAYPRNTIDTQTVNGAVYDANAGIMTVTVVPGGRLIHDGDWIRFDNDSISFKCDMDGGTSTKTYPRSSDPVSGKWLPITGITTTSFSVEVGKSPIAPYSISSAIYDPTAGIVTATIGDHSFMTGQSIQISPESMSFRCGFDTYQSVHNYPRSSDPGFTTAVSIASTSANSISFQVLASQPSTNISTHHFVPHEGLTAEAGTQYDGTVGIMTVRSANHGLSNGDWVLFDTGAVSFTCAKDDYSTVHAYPRTTDPYSGKWIQVSNVTTNTFRTNGMSSPDTSDHIFASGVTGAIKRSQIHGGGAYGHTFQAAGVGSMDQKRDRAFDQPIGIHSVGSTSVTATDAVYDPSAGIMTVTVAGHGFMNNDRVKFDDNSISLKCARDSYRIAHTYPRSSDPISGKWVSIASTTVNTFAVDVGASGPAHQFAHTFDSATTGGIKKQTGYITLQVGVSTDTSVHNYDIGAGHEATNAVVSGGNYAHTFQSATTGAVQYGGAYDHQFVSAASSTLYIDSWSGAALTPTNATYNPATGILQFTAANHGLVKPENFKLAGIGVTCQYGAKTYPSGVQGYYYTVRSVGTTTSFTTFVGVSTLVHPYTGGGTVRVGLTTNIYPDYDQQLDVTGIVSARTFSVNAGISTIPHSYHSGGTASIYYCELTYGSGYTTDLGTITAIGVTDPGNSPYGIGATVTAIVGAGGSLVFNLVNGGTGYSKNTVINVPQPSGDLLSIEGNYREGLGNTTTTGVGASITVDIIGISTNYVGYSTGPEFLLNEVAEWNLAKPGYGFKKGDKFGVTGLSTDPDAGDLFIPFEIEVTDIFNDDISAWQFGNLDYIDNIRPFQDGDRKRYPLYYQNQLISFEIDNNDPDSREIDLGPVLLIFVNGVLQEPNKHYTFNGGTSVNFETAPTINDDVFIFFYRGTVGDDSIFFDVNEIIKEGDSVELFKSSDIELNQVPKNNTNFAQQGARIVTRIATASVVETPFYQGSGVNNDNYKPMRWNKQKVDRVFAGGIVSKARDSQEAQIYPIANVIKSYTDTDTALFVDHNLNFRDVDGLLDDDFGIFVYGVGIGTTAQAGVNWEYWNDIDPLVTDVQGYTGLITGITTSAGIGTDLGLVFQLDTNNLVNEENSSFVTGFTTGYPFRVYGSGISPAAGVITSVDAHDSDPIGISTFELDNIYYAHSVSWDGSARTGVITCNIHSGTNITGLVGVGSTAHPAARFSWGRFSSAIRDVFDPLSLTAKGLDYDPDLDKWPIAQRRNIGLRNTGALGKTL